MQRDVLAVMLKRMLTKIEPVVWNTPALCVADFSYGVEHSVRWWVLAAHCYEERPKVQVSTRTTVSSEQMTHRREPNMQPESVRGKALLVATVQTLHFPRTWICGKALQVVEPL